MPAKTYTDADAIQAYQEAFFHLRPASALLRVMNPHPTLSDTKRLAAAYINNSHSAPEYIGYLTGTLTGVVKSVQIPVKSYSQFHGIQYGSSFAFMLANELEDFHCRHLSEPIVKEIKPTNRYLTSCMLSATTLRHGLATCSSQLRAITDILELDDNPYIPRAVHVVVGLGACIHLLIAGKGLKDQGWMNALGEKQAIKKALKALQKRDASQAANVQKIFKYSLEFIEKDFPRELDAREVWCIVFPDPLRV